MGYKQIHNTTRCFWLDLARFIAIISVTLNHAISRSFAIHPFLA